MNVLERLDWREKNERKHMAFREERGWEPHEPGMIDIPSGSVVVEVDQLLALIEMGKAAQFTYEYLGGAPLCDSNPRDVRAYHGLGDALAPLLSEEPDGPYKGIGED